MRKSSEIDVCCVFNLGCNVAPAVSCLMFSRQNCLMSSTQLIEALFQTRIILSRYGLSGIQDTMDTSFVEPCECICLSDQKYEIQTKPILYCTVSLPDNIVLYLVHSCQHFTVL